MAGRERVGVTSRSMSSNQASTSRKTRVRSAIASWTSIALYLPPSAIQVRRLLLMRLPSRFSSAPKRLAQIEKVRGPQTGSVLVKAASWSITSAPMLASAFTPVSHRVSVSPSIRSLPRKGRQPMRTPRMSPRGWPAAASPDRARPSECGSLRCGPAMTSSISAASATVRAIGPT